MSTRTARRRFTARGVVLGMVTIAGLSAWQGQSILHGVYIGAFAGAVIGSLYGWLRADD
jgi:hypothetical protein